METKEQKLFDRMAERLPDRIASEPRAVLQSMSPFSFWVVIVVLVIFFPAAFVLLIFSKRQLIVSLEAETVIYDMSVWTNTVYGERTRVPHGSGEIERVGGGLRVGGEKLYTFPGWGSATDRLAAIAAGSGEPPA